MMWLYRSVMESKWKQVQNMWPRVYPPAGVSSLVSNWDFILQKHQTFIWCSSACEDGEPATQDLLTSTLLTLYAPVLMGGVDSYRHPRMLWHLTHVASLEKISYQSNLFGSRAFWDINLICHNRSPGSRPHRPDPQANWKVKGGSPRETSYLTRAVPEANEMWEYKKL